MLYTIKEPGGGSGPIPVCVLDWNYDTVLETGQQDKLPVRAFVRTGVGVYPNVGG